ncbi:MAG: hypothetical protein CMJ68_16415 [Planctomycetaceae bacterium]|nr:hypothetical protein [Planctomycetaceae bacterium]
MAYSIQTNGTHQAGPGSGRIGSRGSGTSGLRLADNGTIAGKKYCSRHHLRPGQWVQWVSRRVGCHRAWVVTDRDGDSYYEDRPDQ